MSTPAKVGGFVAALAVIFAAAFGIGKLFDGDSSSYALKLRTTQSGTDVGLRFSVLDNDDPVTKFAVRHEKRLHLILVRDDFAQFRHVHPVMDAAGQWRIDTPLPGGRWRMFADFQPAGGTPEVLHRDFSVRGSAVASPVAHPYQVSLSGTLRAGGDGSMLSFRVSDHGKPVTLQPYLGAFGHLVVLREQDMSYLHVHPGTSAANAPIPFHVEVPTAGRYHLYLDYQVGGVVRTASFVLNAEKGGDMGDMSDMGGMDHGDH